MVHDSPAFSELQIQQALRTAVAAADRGDYAGALRVFKLVYETSGVTAPPDGLSAYGLCVAVEEKLTKKGVELCRAGIAAQSYDSRHFVNLINLYLKRGHRIGAVETLSEALGKMPKDSTLLALREKLGIRKAPPIPFLSRDNALNRILSGRRSGEPKQRTGSLLRSGSLHPVVAGALALVFFATVFGSTFYYLYHQAYG